MQLKTGKSLKTQHGLSGLKLQRDTSHEGGGRIRGTVRGMIIDRSGHRQPLGHWRPRNFRVSKKGLALWRAGSHVARLIRPKALGLRV